MLQKLAAFALAFALYPIAASADPCSDIVGMYEAMGAATAYREKKVEPGGLIITTEFVAPDRTHTITDGHEQINIGNRAWSKLLGHWIEGPGGSHKSTTEIWKETAENGTLMQRCRSANVTDLGMVDGFHAIRFESAKFGVLNVTYLRPDLLPVKVEVTTRGKTYVTTYADWNAQITIDAP